MNNVLNGLPFNPIDLENTLCPGDFTCVSTAEDMMRVINALETAGHPEPAPYRYKDFSVNKQSDGQLVVTINCAHLVSEALRSGNFEIDKIYVRDLGITIDAYKAHNVMFYFSKEGMKLTFKNHRVYASKPERTFTDGLSGFAIALQANGAFTFTATDHPELMRGRDIDDDCHLYRYLTIDQFCNPETIPVFEKRITENTDSDQPPELDTTDY